MLALMMIEDVVINLIDLQFAILDAFLLQNQNSYLEFFNHLCFVFLDQLCYK